MAANTEYTVVDDFLGRDDFEKTQVLMSNGFPWYLASFVNSAEMDAKVPHCFQFTHMLYSNFKPNSDFVHLIFPIVERLQMMGLVRVKANLLTRTEKKIYHGFHTDYHSSLVTTAIYYINTNDGVTAIKTKNGVKEVNSVANRLLIFNSRLEHTGSTCTDENVRCVINFNYITDIKHLSEL